MTGSAGVDWVWLANDAIAEFKQRRIRDGATTASASSYATGARAFVRYCRGIERSPGDAIESFDDYLARAPELSPNARSNYRSHARAFVQFLRDRPGSQPRVAKLSEALSIRSPKARPNAFEASSDRDDVERTLSVRATPARQSDPAHWLDSLADASTAELLAGYARSLNVLRARGVVRTSNAPLGDFAEWLVWKAFGGRIEPNSTKSHDVTDAAGRRLQVKARLVSERPTPSQLQTSVFRSWTFDFAVLIQLAERDYSVVQASMLPAHLFDAGRLNARWSEHVKGWAVFMTPVLMNHPEATDVTTQLRKAATES